MTAETSTTAATVPQWTFADRIRKIRRDHKLTQTEFAERIEANQKTVGAWEAGTNEPEDVVAVAKRVQLAFGTPAAWTLDVQSGGPSPNQTVTVA